MKININIKNQAQDDGVNPEEFGYPQGQEVLAAPAALELQFFNLATILDDQGEYQDDLILETALETPVSKTVELTKGAYSNRQQTENTTYYKNSYSLDPQTIVDNYGPKNVERFKREPLKPIVVGDPDTNPPYNKDVDDMLRRDGIGVNTPIFHVELLKDKQPNNQNYYKKDRIIRGINVDIKRSMRSYPNSYHYSKKYKQAKQYKKKEPLTFLIENIWDSKAHLSIEEIESASHFITSMVGADDDMNPLGMGYSIDSVEGIFYNKFDTYLAQDRTYTGEEGQTIFSARYKITTEPLYTATAYKKAIFQFIAGGIVKAKVYMMPRNWWYYARFYATSVCEENGGGLADLSYIWYNRTSVYDPWTPTYYHYPALIRAPIGNTTKLFALWGKPPHDYRLPRRDDDSIDNLYLHMDSSFLTGFCNFDVLGNPGYWGYDPETHTYIQGRYDNAPPGDTWVSLPEQCWESPFVFLHDAATSDTLYRTETTDIRGFSNRGFATYPVEAGDKFFDNSKYGWLRGAMRGLFLYNFPALAWVSGGPNDAYVFQLGGVAMDRNLPPIHTNSHFPREFGGHVFWHKTPNGIVPHWYTRPWINQAVGIWWGQGNYMSRGKNCEFYQSPSFIITPPDGGVMKFDSTTEPITCREYKNDDDTGSQQIYSDISECNWPSWNECSRKAYDGSIYDEDEVIEFQKLWTKITNFQAYKDEMDLDPEYVDNVPYIIGVAGAKAGSLVAIIKIEGGKTLYIWRAVDEEEGEAPIPLLSIAGNTTYYETHYDDFGHPYYWSYWWPIFNSGEIWNQWHQTGNIKTAYDTTSVTDYNVPIIQMVPGLGRIATKIVHQFISWPNDVLDTLFDESYPTSEYHYSVPPNMPGGVPILTQPSVDTEDVFDLEMPVYLMTYREQALRDEGQGATRWAGSFMKAGGKISCTSYESTGDGSDSGNVWEVTAAKRNRDMC